MSYGELLVTCLVVAKRATNVVEQVDALRSIELEVFDALLTGIIDESVFYDAVALIDSVIISYLGRPFGLYCYSVDYLCDACVYVVACQEVAAALRYEPIEDPLERLMRRVRHVVRRFTDNDVLEVMESDAWQKENQEGRS